LLGKRPPEGFVLELVAAASEVGPRWPGKARFSFANQYPSSSPFYHHWRWPHFLAAVFEQRSWIEQLAHCESWDVRRGSIEVLGAKWPDEATRTLLADRAVQDQTEFVRSAALQSLAEKWPDPTTRTLLAERARIDGVAASLIGAQHSQFGRIIFTRDVDGQAPYLYPRQPVSRKHIQKAAARANIVPEQIDQAVRSLSQLLGWDITIGAK
jgi:hypothetical protein